MQNVTINREQELFVIPCNNGYSCLGFDIVQSRIDKLSTELGIEPKTVKKGTMASYNEYLRLMEVALSKHRLTGLKSQSELIPEFIGKEGRRVEVVTSWGEKKRFYIGKSTGFIPCHLEIKTKRSTGGSAVCGHPFKIIRYLD